MTTIINTIDFYIQIKIDRNNLLLKVIDLQNTILCKKILMQNKIIQCNKVKAEILNTVNKIEERQKQEFDIEAHNITSKMYDDYTAQIPDNFEMIKSDIIIMETECMKIMEKVNKYNTCIPNTVDWANIYFERNNSPIIDDRFLEDTEE